MVDKNIFVDLQLLIYRPFHTEVLILHLYIENKIANLADTVIWGTAKREINQAIFRMCCIYIYTGMCEYLILCKLLDFISFDSVC